ncbi:MAG: hypothetical protein Q9160_006340 [Pyrenula sp. 1 TL-2023]
MSSAISAWIKQTLVYTIGLVNFFLYLIVTVQNRSFHFLYRGTKREKLLLAKSRDEFWNLSKEYDGLFHCFYTLKNSGLKLHYLSNHPEPTHASNNKPLVFLIHGFPDSCFVWRELFHRFRKTELLKNATVIAVDLPGYGGSDSFPNYGATEILEALTEFIAGKREAYYEHPMNGNGESASDNYRPREAYIVGHDWGCILAYRLAAEAPYLADRFILSNGVHPQHAWSNQDRIISSATKMLRTCWHNPLHSRVVLTKVVSTVKPLLKQFARFGYAFVFQLPNFLVSLFLNAGNHVFFRTCHKNAFGSRYENPDRDIPCMASTLGPSLAECETSTSYDDKEQTPHLKGPGYGTEKPQSYPPSVVRRAKHGNAIDMTAYYRDGLLTQPWDKSLETLTTMHDFEEDSKSRRRSFGASLFSENFPGALRAPVTVLWGADDPVIMKELCLDGIGDYLAKGSEVVLLKGLGHWGVLCNGFGVQVLEEVLRRVTERGYEGGAVSGRIYKTLRQHLQERWITVVTK